MPVTLDPRYHDAVVFDLDGARADDATIVGSAVELARKLHRAGVATAAYSSRPEFRRELTDAGLDDLFDVCVDGIARRGAQDDTGRASGENPEVAVLAQATRGLGVRPQRCVVLERSGAGVAAGRDAGFVLVIGIGDQADDLSRSGADVVVGDLADIAVRNGDTRISDLPNALESYGQLIGITGTRDSMLFLDYDGTLSPIVSDPAAAKLVDGAAEALAHAAKASPVAILSGRDLEDVRSRVDIPGLWYAGSHGFELTGPDGTRHQNETAAQFIPVLENAAAELSENLAQVPGVRVEHKRYAVAVHYREVAAERVGEVVAAAHAVGARDGLRVTSGRMIVELRPDIDWDKGTTLAWIRDRIDQTGSMLPIYIGDDLTDEDAFDAVRFDGIGIVVAHDEDGNRKSAAHFTLRSPEQVREFIERGSGWLAYKQRVSN
ncbi:MAG: trehalose-phosphatase, partial [Actinomycetia bacterium]|nr:trehalose-phosphatase [Actinomycetes bacterium]